MVVKGKQVLHCHGKDAGKPIATLGSHKKAVAMHRAIQANKKRGQVLGK